MLVIYLTKILPLRIMDLHVHIHFTRMGILGLANNTERRERLFDFKGVIFLKKIHVPFFKKNYFQDRVNSIVRFVIYANQKTGSCRG